jgi:hypothetical protein
VERYPKGIKAYCLFASNFLEGRLPLSSPPIPNALSFQCFSASITFDSKLFSRLFREGHVQQETCSYFACARLCWSRIGGGCYAHVCKNPCRSSQVVARSHDFSSTCIPTSHKQRTSQIHLHNIFVYEISGALV